MSIHERANRHVHHVANNGRTVSRDRRDRTCRGEDEYPVVDDHGRRRGGGAIGDVDGVGGCRRDARGAPGGGEKIDHKWADGAWVGDMKEGIGE